MRRSVLWLSLAALAACGGTQSNTTTANPTPQAPSPGPRAEDGIDDHTLMQSAADLVGRTGEDLAHAQLRLLVNQTRAFVVAVVHALPVSSATPENASGSPNSSPPPAVEARFDPPATLIQQLEATHECSNGGDAHTCAGRLGNQLLARIDALHAPHDLEGVRLGLLSSLAALEESRVVIATDVRWHVLQEGEDPAAHLAQALSLLLIQRRVATAVAVGCPCEETAHIAARLADDLAIGQCSDAYEHLLGPDGAMTDSRAGLAALANAGCVPACARAGLTGSGSDPIEDAANACRGEGSEVALRPFEDAAHSLGDWYRTAKTRLEALNNDPAVAAILAARPTVAQGAMLPMPPALFHVSNGAEVAVAAAPGAPGNGVAMGATSAIVWIPPSGDVIAVAAPQFSLEAIPVTTPGAGPIDGVVERIHAVAVPAPAGGERAPFALAVDPNARAARVTGVLSQLAHAAGDLAAHPLIVGFAIRHGAIGEFVPFHVMGSEPGRVYRISERQVTVIEHGRGTQFIALAPPAATGPDLLNGAIPDAAPSDPYAIQLEPDVSGATLARVANALAVHAGRAAIPQPPGILPALAEGPVLVGTMDDAHAAAVRTAIESHHAEAMHCLESVHAEANAAPARVDVHLMVDARGRITRADVTGDDAHAQPAVQCVQRAARRWRIPAAGGAIEVRVGYVGERVESAHEASGAPAASAAPAAGGHRHGGAGR